ncbi:N-acetyltransferase family protein [Brevibacillus ginsengisoli]|uniref:GNAT family N-acetyltransferase n=1 Tax=Brevibacillus ginsengisoli TaxID=363854 RepID=UPI003CEBE5B0
MGESIRESERMIFTTVRPEDISKLMDIHNSNPFYNLVSTGKLEVTQEEIEEDLNCNTEFSDSYSILLIEKNSGELIGHSQFITCNPRDNKPWLGLIITHKDQQGKGYAREFIEVLVSWLEDRGFDELHLAVLEKNEKVLPFYHQLGFAYYETRVTEKYGPARCLKRVFKGSSK